LNEQISAYKAQVDTLEKKPAVNWVYVIIAVVSGLIIGYLLKGH
jgi:exodeoxyribonuclease VII large subunit